MNTSFLDFAALLPRAGQLRADWQSITSSALALTLQQLAAQQTQLVLVIARDSQHAHILEQDLRAFAADLPLLSFPDWETLPYDLFSPHPEIVSQRIASLYALPKVERGILVVPISSLLQRLPPRNWLSNQCIDLRKGQRLDLNQERLRLQDSGYRAVQQVQDPGDFAVRGALLDLFPAGSEQPIRIELFDDVIESLRYFDPDTQRSDASIDVIQLLPAREFPMDAAACKRAREQLSERFDIDPRRSPLYQDLKEGLAPAGVEYYLPLFFDHTDTLFDYLPRQHMLVLCEEVETSVQQFLQQTQERWEQRRHDIERPVLAPHELYLREEELRAHWNGVSRVEILPKTHARFAQAHTLPFSVAPDLPWTQRNETAGRALTDFLAAYPGRTLLLADSPGRREVLIELLNNADLHPQLVQHPVDFFASTAAEKFCISVATLDNGFSIQTPVLCVLTERQLFPERASQPRRRQKAARDPESILRDLNEISIGAPIVHEDHGVGRYQGLITLDSGGVSGEYLCVEYAKGDKLYVPVAQLHLVSRYSGTSPEHAPLHNLGGEAWEKAKRKAAEKVRDVAAELLDIQARRQARAGLALAIDRTMYEPFAASFPFEETADQANTIESVITDLSKPTPMDRVVCGDVGFGKTEVAIRAAFVTATAGKQVAVLVPTTLLAEQHYRNFRDRYADWPIRVEVLSRFKSPKEIKAALELVAEGKIDVIVGTHRLLQPDIHFKDLGLVIVDEEQRFGVRQKEALKALRAEVHLLTLTATPIPRTLNMAMSGLRELSLIATPPAHRLAVKTSIATWDKALLLEAFQRELARGGQVYFLHNDVQTIEKMTRELEEMLPDARIRIAHGQMPERELEQVMLDFHRQRFNVLVCSTIIESGIDVPSANTIIINRADKFGLAQLHQLRGRVGRSHHRAYAYLIIPNRKALSGDAEKRLEALASMEELGAGFTLATHDLEIRGAGELLGEEQSGQITEVGFSLYSELLERAVRALKSGKMPDTDITQPRGCEVELHSPALIPEDFLPDVHARLIWYKRISSAKSASELSELQVEMIDRYGVLPDPAKQLFQVADLRLQAEPLGIKRLELGENGGRIHFNSKPNIDPMSVIRMIQSQPKHYAMDGSDKLRIRIALPDAAARLRAARGLISTLSTH